MVEVDADRDEFAARRRFRQGCNVKHLPHDIDDVAALGPRAAYPDPAFDPVGTLRGLFEQIDQCTGCYWPMHRHCSGAGMLMAPMVVVLFAEQSGDGQFVLGVLGVRGVEQ